MFCSFLLNFPSIKIPPSTGAEGQHICMVFEYLGDNLLILIKYSILTTVAWIFIWLRRFVITCWFWLDYLQRELSVVHSDLKPENVLVPSMIGPSKVPRKSGVTLVLPSNKDKTVDSNGDFVKNQKKDVRRALLNMTKLMEWDQLLMENH